MKNLVALFAMTFFTVTLIQAAEVNVKSDPVVIEYQDSQRDQDKTEMNVTALPAEVRESLRQETTNGWVAQKAWKIKEKNETCYKVELEKDGKARKVKFNSDGKKMDYDKKRKHYDKKKKHKNPPR